MRVKKNDFVEVITGKNRGKLRAFHMIKHLSRAHEVTVVSPVRSAEEEGEAQGEEKGPRSAREGHQQEAAEWHADQP